MCQSLCSSWFSCHCLLVRLCWLCNIHSLWFSGGYSLADIFSLTFKIFIHVLTISWTFLGTTIDKTLPNSLWNKRKRFCKICCVPVRRWFHSLKMILSFLFFSQHIKVRGVKGLGPLPNVTCSVSRRAGVLAPKSLPTPPPPLLMLSYSCILGKLWQT